MITQNKRLIGIVITVGAAIAHTINSDAVHR